MLRKPMPLDMTHLPRQPASVTQTERIAQPDNSRCKPHYKKHVKATQGIQ